MAEIPERPITNSPWQAPDAELGIVILRIVLVQVRTGVPGVDVRVASPVGSHVVMGTVRSVPAAAAAGTCIGLLFSSRLLGIVPTQS